jgi:hypothetical protein
VVDVDVVAMWSRGGKKMDEVGSGIFMVGLGLRGEFRRHNTTRAQPCVQL